MHLFVGFLFPDKTHIYTGQIYPGYIAKVSGIEETRHTVSHQTELKVDNFLVLISYNLSSFTIQGKWICFNAVVTNSVEQNLKFTFNRKLPPSFFMTKHLY